MPRRSSGMPTPRIFAWKRWACDIDLGVDIMPDLQDGESTEMQGSGAKPYVLKNVGGVYSCSCPAWRNQSIAIEKRTCKHLRKLRGDSAEEERIGGPAPERAHHVKEDVQVPPLLLAER